LRVAVHQPQYFPYPGFFHKLSTVDLFVLMDDVQYDKRYTNRNRIVDSHGPIWLTVPINKAQKGLPNAEIEVNNDIPWAKDHWKKIQLSYSNSRGFPAYREFLEQLYQRTWTKLLDLNMETLKETMKWLGIEIPVLKESQLGVNKTGTERIVEVCKAVGADTYVSGIGGRNYLVGSLFERNGLRLEYQDYHAVPYPQRLTKQFIPDLSILDMLANVGPQSPDYIAAGGRPDHEIRVPMLA
jgi:WbqC-like protein family